MWKRTFVAFPSSLSLATGASLLAGVATVACCDKCELYSGDPPIHEGEVKDAHPSGRVIVIGDVHGCFDEMVSLLDKVEYSKERGDTVIFVGDLVGKGPRGAEVVQFAKDNKLSCVRGNHEDYMIRWYEQGLRGEPREQLKPTHAKTASELTADEWQWLRGLPLAIRLPDLNACVVHAGLAPGLPLFQQRRNDLMYMRNISSAGKPSERIGEGTPWTRLWKGPFLVIFGHDALRGLHVSEYSIGLDTGCCYGRELTAVVLPERKIFSVPASKGYAPASRGSPTPPNRVGQPDS